MFHAHLFESGVNVTKNSNIIGEEVLDHSIVLTAIEFEKTSLELRSVLVSDYEDSYQAGKTLAEQLDPEGLQTIFVLSDGHLVNGRFVSKPFKAIELYETILVQKLEAEKKLQEI